MKLPENVERLCLAMLTAWKAVQGYPPEPDALDAAKEAWALVLASDDDSLIERASLIIAEALLGLCPRFLSAGEVAISLDETMALDFTAAFPELCAPEDLNAIMEADETVERH